MIRVDLKYVIRLLLIGNSGQEGFSFPIVKSLSLSPGSKPNDPSAKKLGSYLVQSPLQGCDDGTMGQLLLGRSRLHRGQGCDDGTICLLYQGFRLSYDLLASSILFLTALEINISIY